MMRLWNEEHTRVEHQASGTAMSVVVHAVLIALAVVATNPPAGLVSQLYGLANRVFYVAPPPREIRSPESQQLLKFVEAAPIGPGAGFLKGGPMGTEPPVDRRAFASVAGDLGTELNSTPLSRRFTGADSVFTIAEVDSAVTTDPMSAAPEYPAGLLKLGIEGTVMVRYIVDSTGAADVSSLEVIRTSRVEFAVAVREALPKMRFTPARIGARRVSQLVEQPYHFRIIRPTDTVQVTGKKPPD